MERLSIREGINKYLDGRKVTVYAPVNIDELTVEDLQTYEHGNAFCVVEDESDDEEAVETVPEEPELEKPKRQRSTPARSGH